MRMLLLLWPGEEKKMSKRKFPMVTVSLESASLNPFPA